jgi:ABC-type multidrug transport system fused ATPase/permease subunit
MRREDRRASEMPAHRTERVGEADTRRAAELPPRRTERAGEADTRRPAELPPRPIETARRAAEKPAHRTERAGEADTRRAAELPPRRTERKKSLESLLDAPEVRGKRSGPVPAGEKVTNFPGQGLEFKNLSYSVIKKQKKDGVKIKKEVYLLNDISGQALRGQVTAILGPSGAGKSTFLDAIAGRIAKGSLEGFVSIDGRPVRYIAHFSVAVSGTRQQGSEKIKGMMHFLML